MPGIKKLKLAKWEAAKKTWPQTYVSEFLAFATFEFPSHGGEGRGEGEQSGFITIDADKLREIAAKHFPHIKKRVVKQVTRSVTQPGKPTERKQAARMRPTEEQELYKSICATCEHFEEQIERCDDSKCGCPSASSRIRPWKNRRNICAAWRQAKLNEMFPAKNPEAEEQSGIRQSPPAPAR